MTNWINKHEELVFKVFITMMIVIAIGSMVLHASIYGIFKPVNADDFIPEVNVETTAMDELTVTLLEEYADYYAEYYE